jgi:hypothetical protein
LFFEGGVYWVKSPRPTQPGNDSEAQFLRLQNGKSFYDARLPNAAPHKRHLFWEYENYFNIDRGMLESSGETRLIGDNVQGNAAALYDLAGDPSGKTRILPTSAQQMETLESAYQAWHKYVHTVEFQSDLDQSGRGSLRGMDFLRTPGSGPYTFGIAWAGAPPGIIARQGDIWSLSQTGNIITAQFGSMLLSGKFSSNSGCHSVIVSGKFARKDGYYGQQGKSTLDLYIDGILVDNLAVDGQPKAMNTGAGTATHTQIGLSDSNQSATFSRPIILNISLDDSPYFTSENLAEELCQSKL